MWAVRLPVDREREAQLLVAMEAAVRQPACEVLGWLTPIRCDQLNDVQSAEACTEADLLRTKLVVSGKYSGTSIEWTIG